MNNIELEFKKCQEWYKKYHTRKGYKMVDKVINLLLSKPNKIWWWSWEVNNKKTILGMTSHRGCARLTDLAKAGICESREIGEYTVYRLKITDFNNINKIISTMYK